MKKIIGIITVLSLSVSFAQEHPDYRVKNLESNSSNSDFGVTFFGDSLVIFASSRRDKTIRKRVWSGNKQPFLEIFQAEIDSAGEFKNLDLFSKTINTKYHESNLAFTKDLKTVYFSRNNYINKKIIKDDDGKVLIQLYKATVGEAGEWSDITPMPFNSDNYQTGHPVLSKDETKLYFISDMEGSYGMTDVYVVDIFEDGSYGEPINLGPNVNSTEKELFPFISDDNILYWSSEGFDSTGGLDVFANKIVNGKAIDLPIKLGASINTKADDFAFVFKPDSRTGYLSSNRKGGKGDDDIYYFEELNPLNFKCENEIFGVVRDKRTNALLPGALVELVDSNGKVLESTISDRYAKFSFKLDCETSYSIKGSKESFDPDTKTVETENVADQALNIELSLDNQEFKSLRGQLMININPIYFDLNKDNIRLDAAIELEKVVRIMQKYPQLKVELGSHTDSRGDNDYNMDLSDRRAKSSRNWIIKRGIDGSRITAKGFGETQLLNNCADGILCTEAEHQVNRRTEFIIVNPEVIR